MYEDIQYTVVTGCHKKFSEANEDCEDLATSGKRGQLAILDTVAKRNALDSSFWCVLNKAMCNYFHGLYFVLERSKRLYLVLLHVKYCREEDVWIGLSDKDSEDIFVWIDGTPLDLG